MATGTSSTKHTIKGGSFLIESRAPGEIFTPEDLNDQHKSLWKRKSCLASRRWRKRNRGCFASS